MKYLVFQDEYFYHTDKITLKLIRQWKNNEVQGIIDLDTGYEMVYSIDSEIAWKPIKRWG